MDGRTDNVIYFWGCSKWNHTVDHAWNLPIGFSFFQNCMMRLHCKRTYLPTDQFCPNISTTCNFYTESMKPFSKTIPWYPMTVSCLAEGRVIVQSKPEQKCLEFINTCTGQISLTWFPHQASLTLPSNTSSGAETKHNCHH